MTAAIARAMTLKSPIFTETSPTVTVSFHDRTATVHVTGHGNFRAAQ